ncbi:unnamed protein product [Echinostoma caproni]|uniref:Uncharacterized protein n=1 Tax=Echinostoma caproni TaxID=27848 RepID=A0A3P8GAW3_9TREM|nr:unnamed protein product [Echinostoma caproni]
MAANRADPPFPRPRPLWGPLCEAIMSASCSSPVLGPCLTESIHMDQHALGFLYPHLHSAICRHPRWLLRTIQSPTLWTFVHTVGGTQLVEEYLLPLVLLLYRSDYVERAMATSTNSQHPLSELCSRRFLRLVMAHVRLDTFLALFTPCVIHVLLSSSTHCPRAGSCKPRVENFVRDKEETRGEKQTFQSVIGSTKPDLETDLPEVRPLRSSFVDEIGLDLRSVDTEDELLDLFMDAKKCITEAQCPSIRSNTASVRSHDSVTVQFSLELEAENNISTGRSTQPTQIHSLNGEHNSTTDDLTDSKPAVTSHPQPSNDTDSNQDAPTSHNTIPPVAACTDSLIWIAKRVGPLITAKTLIRYLLAGLTGNTQLTVLTSSNSGGPGIRSYLPIPIQTTNRPLAGDRSAAACLRCLEQLVCVYGVSLVQHVYMPFVDKAVSQVMTSVVCPPDDSDPCGSSSMNGMNITNSWNSRTLARVVAGLTLLQQFIAYLPDSKLSDQLQDSSLQDLLIKAVRLAGRHDVSFPAGATGRRAVLYKIIDCIYVIGLRIGFELTRVRLTSLIQLFFAMFDRVPLVETHQELGKWSSFMLDR